MREAAETDQLAHGETRDEVVVLAQNRQHLRQILRLGLAHVVWTDVDVTGIDGKEAANHSQERGLARAVRADQSRDCVGWNFQVNGAN